MATLNPFKTIKKLKELIGEPIEAIAKEPTGIVKGVSDEAKKELHQATQDMWKQILMPENEKNTHHDGPVEMSEGHEIDLSQHASDSKDAGHGEKSAHSEADPHINYKREILHYRETISNSENRELNQTVNEIMMELKRLIDSSTIVSAELNAVTVTQAPTEVGKYHINFFEWMLLTLQTARMKVEDSGAWLATMGSKKGKKDYWSEFKKHGTSFGMSNERGVATQTG